MRLAEVDRIKRLDQAKTKLIEQTGKVEGKDIGGELDAREFPASDFENKSLINKTAKNGRSNIPEIKRLSPEEEQGRIRAGETAIHATAILERLHKAMRGNRKEIVEAEQKELELYAKNSNQWVEDVDNAYLKKGENEKGVGIDNTRSGMEQTAYFDDDGNVVKANRNTMHESILDLIDSVALHNTFDTHTQYEIIGFGKNSNGNFVTILKQSLS